MDPALASEDLARATGAVLYCAAVLVRAIALQSGRCRCVEARMAGWTVRCDPGRKDPVCVLRPHQPCRRPGYRLDHGAGPLRLQLCRSQGSSEAAHPVSRRQELSRRTCRVCRSCRPDDWYLRRVCHCLDKRPASNWDWRRDLAGGRHRRVVPGSNHPKAPRRPSGRRSCPYDRNCRPAPESFALRVPLSAPVSNHYRCQFANPLHSPLHPVPFAHSPAPRYGSASLAVQRKLRFCLAPMGCDLLQAARTRDCRAARG